MADARPMLGADGLPRKCFLCHKPLLFSQRVRMQTFSIKGRSIFAYAHEGTCKQ